jgi:hypothetical protein
MQLGWGVREQWQSCEKAHVIYTIRANRVPARKLHTPGIAVILELGGVRIIRVRMRVRLETRPARNRWEAEWLAND